MAIPTVNADGKFRLEVGPNIALRMAGLRGTRTKPNSGGDLNDAVGWVNLKTHLEFVTEYIQRAIVRIQPLADGQMDLNINDPTAVNDPNAGFVLRDSDYPSTFPDNFPGFAMPKWAIDEGYALWILCYCDAGRRYVSDINFEAVGNKGLSWHLGATNPQGIHNQWVTYDYDVGVTLDPM